MFTGIIESMGEITAITKNRGNRSFQIASPISAELKVDQSLSHNGVCLTVEEVKDDWHRVTAIRETLQKTNLKNWKTGGLVNLERCLPLNGRLDGHLVQGHVDGTAICTRRLSSGGSWEFEFEFDKQFGHLVIEKGSICLNGISLTLFAVRKKSFRVAIIPFTFEHTNMKNIRQGSVVNLEFDIIGKYISRMYGGRKK